MNLAESWRSRISTGEVQFANIAEYLRHLQLHDLESELQATDVGVLIIFSDGSMHRMGSLDK